jgi:pyridoxal phosphate enzyme (YggS family)
MGVIENYKRIRDEIGAIAASTGRNIGDIRIIAVSKTFDAPIIQEAIDGGIRLFGENKVQEAKRKIPVLAGDFAFHMLGHLQTNKARDAVRLFDVIHTIDKISTAGAVADEAARAGKRQKVLIQVNASGEETKSGIDPGDAVSLARGVTGLADLELLGLMTMAPFTDDPVPVRNSFRIARRTLDDINRDLGLALRELSMGMSADYRIAVEEGATLVRIGTAIFGQRGEG